MEDVQLSLVETLDDALELKRWLGERRPILGLDTETEGLHFHRHKLRLVQLGDARRGWAIPFDDWKQLVRELLNGYDGEMVGHNIKFDAHFLAEHADVRLDFTRLHDSRIAAHLLKPDERTGLKALAAKLVHPRAAVGEEMLQALMAKGKWDWATVPVHLTEYWAYGALDPVLSARLHELLAPQLHQWQLADLYELERAVAHVLFRMEERGCRVDTAYCERKRQELEDFALRARAWCQETYGCSPGSSQEVIRHLQADGVTLTKRTKTRQLALDEEVLKAVDHDLARLVLNVRHAEKMAHAYFENLLEFHRGGVVHAMINQLGARTGRMSITDPALQTLPREDAMVRDAFVARDETACLLSADYDQMEMKVFAHFAEEEEMIRKIREGVDLHTITAQGVYGLGDRPPTKTQRQIAKNANFTRIYGGGPRKFAQTAGISEAEGRAFYQAYDEAFPKVTPFQDHVQEVAYTRFLTEGRAYVRASSGRVHPAEEDRLYPLVNYLVQGTCADVLKRKLVDLELSGLGEYLTLPVHDEVILDAPHEQALEVAAETRRVMEEHHEFSVPLTVDVEGPMERWGEKYRA